MFFGLWELIFFRLWELIFFGLWEYIFFRPWELTFLGLWGDMMAGVNLFQVSQSNYNQGADFHTQLQWPM